MKTERPSLLSSHLPAKSFPYGTNAVEAPRRFVRRSERWKPVRLAAFALAFVLGFVAGLCWCVGAPQPGLCWVVLVSVVVGMAADAAAGGG